MADPLTVAGIVGAGLAGFFGGKRGGKRGAENTLNGTAEAVRRIETKVDTLGADVSDVRERLAFIEGVVDRRDTR